MTGSRLSCLLSVDYVVFLFMAVCTSTKICFLILLEECYLNAQNYLSGTILLPAFSSVQFVFTRRFIDSDTDFEEFVADTLKILSTL